MVKISEMRFGQKADFVRMTSLIVDRKTDVISGAMHAVTMVTLWFLCILIYIRPLSFSSYYQHLSSLNLGKCLDFYWRSEQTQTNKQANRQTETDQTDRQTGRDRDRGWDGQTETNGPAGRQIARYCLK